MPYEQKILTKLLDDTAAASIVGDVDSPAASLGVDNRIDTAETERDIRASFPTKTGNKAAVAAVAGEPRTRGDDPSETRKASML